MSHFNTQALVFTAFHQTMFKNFGKKHGQIKPSTPWFGMQNHEYLKPPGYSLVLPEFGIGPEPDRTRTLKGPSHNILWMDKILHQLVTIGIPTKHCKELGCNGILPIYKLVQDFFHQEYVLTFNRSMDGISQRCPRPRFVVDEHSIAIETCN